MDLRSEREVDSFSARYGRISFGIPFGSVGRMVSSSLWWVARACPVPSFYTSSLLFHPFLGKTQMRAEMSKRQKCQKPPQGQMSVVEGIRLSNGSVQFRNCHYVSFL